MSIYVKLRDGKTERDREIDRQKKRERTGEGEWCVFIQVVDVKTIRGGNDQGHIDWFRLPEL